MNKLEVQEAELELNFFPETLKRLKELDKKWRNLKCLSSKNASQS